MLYRLLIADDESQSRNTLSTCFPWDSVGFEVVAQAYNGHEALKYIHSNPIDVILCDIRMPGMDGIELAKQLHAEKSETIIVFLSGYRDFEYAQQAIRYGVRFYMVKPATYEELKKTFTELKMDLDFKYKPNELSQPPSVLEQDLCIEKLKMYIEQNYRNANLKEASQLIYMNSSYISQLFKQKTGENFSDYLLGVRMKKAAELLKNPNYKIYDISTQIGYTNAKNFARSFRNYYGKSPKEFRDAYHLVEVNTYES